VRRRTGIVGGIASVTAAAASGAVVVAGRRVTGARRRGIAAQDAMVWEPADRSGHVTGDGGLRLYFEEDGPADAPATVVLVHGFCLDHHDFLFQRRMLRERFGDSVRIVSFDLRSHGRSQRAQSEHSTIDHLGADLYAILETLVPTGPVVLVGHSMGGMTIMALADQHPELFRPGGTVAGVALISTSTGKLAGVSLGLPAALAKLRGPVLPVLLRGVRQQSALLERGRARATDIAWVFVGKLAFGGPVDPALVEFVSRLIAATPIDVIADFYSTLMDHDKLAALDALVGNRVLVVCGEEDLITPPDHSRAIADMLPDAELVLVPRAGHLVQLEKPHEVEGSLGKLVEGVLQDGRRRRRSRL
jgi:pimeloyl-ACP methyl ester carboxylesterase